MWEKAEPVVMSRGDRELLESLVRSGRTPQKVALRARIVLGAADGRSNNALAQELGVTRPTILCWRRRFAVGGVQRLLKDAPRGRPRAAVSGRKVEAIVNATLRSQPKDATHWSSRTMAAAQGVSQSTIVRVWQAHGLQPHRVASFKLSRDPEFVDKLRDVVGLYLDPPDKAIVFCVDEKSQIQALDRTQPALPMRQGRPESRTHDYVRHGTTTLFAALNILDGTVIGRCQPHHTHVEFVAFLEDIERVTPRRREVHLVIDNYGTHKHPVVRAWLAAHPRFQVHFVPTSSSWLNLIERWFADITRKRIRRGTFKNVAALIRAIESYIRENNKHPKPFVWTATPAAILRKVRRCIALQESGH
jgi:transposase